MRKTSLDEVMSWVRAVAAGMESGTRFYGPNFLKPFHLATFALLAKRYGRQRFKVPGNIESYAARMGLWEAAGLEPPLPVPKRDPSGRFLPTQALTERSKVAETSQKLVQIARAQGMSEEMLSSLGVALHELLENCFAHAEVRQGLHGLACAQTWPRADLAQVAIVDSGIGIRASLSANASLSARLQTENSCALATEFGVTSKPEGHSGYGLTLARQLIEQNGGCLIVLSQNEAYFTREGQEGRDVFDVPWPGTAVVLEWNTNKLLDVAPIYESWPLPEGITDDDFDF